MSPPCRQPCMGASIVPPVERRVRLAEGGSCEAAQPWPPWVWVWVWLSRSPQARPPDIWRDPLSLCGQAGPSLLCGRGEGGTGPGAGSCGPSGSPHQGSFFPRQRGAEREGVTLGFRGRKTSPDGARPNSPRSSQAPAGYWTVPLMTSEPHPL